MMLYVLFIIVPRFSDSGGQVELENIIFQSDIYSAWSGPFSVTNNVWSTLTTSL